MALGFLECRIQILSSYPTLSDARYEAMLDDHKNPLYRYETNIF